jgi:heme a synthase
VSVSHAGLAQIFFSLTVAIAVFTSPGWREAYGRGRTELSALAADVTLRLLAVGAVALVFVQILLGATMRHSGAGMAIPDFPLAFGRLVPPLQFLAVWPVALHFAHRVGAVVVAGIAVYLALRIRGMHPRRSELAAPAWWLLGLVALQVALGGWTVLSGRDVAVNTAHVAVGALVFATTVVLGLRIYRPFFESGMATARAGAREPARAKPTPRPSPARLSATDPASCESPGA